MDARQAWRNDKAAPVGHRKSSPEGIRLVMMQFVWFSLSLQNVEGLFYGRAVEISHEAVLLW